ncbi:hypothetical protein [Janthinobacterium sp. LB2P10]|uniref:hypothetical protein n=1 Tax=Janthinobacterium sp. LB2P10 TaxID=3424194 RepID=UPI003F24CF2B
MKNQENIIAANKRLAELLGWTNIVEVGGALVGTPPAGAAASRGQALVPDWLGDWAAAGPMIGQFKMSVGFTGIDAVATARDYEKGAAFEAIAGHATADAAARVAIVRAIISALEACQ